MAVGEQIFGLMLRVLSQDFPGWLRIRPISAQYLVEADDLCGQTRHLTPERNERAVCVR